MPRFRPIDEQLCDVLRGAVDVIHHDELPRLLEKSAGEDRPLRVKLGIDPSSPDIHLGHTVVLRRLRAFQDHGHHVVLIIGDYTAMVGDPSGRNKTRPQLTIEDVERNAQTYFDQASKVLDFDRIEVRRNGEWFGKMSFLDVLKLCSRSTVARLLERDDFQKRYESQTPISLHEFLYPLMQGWDSVMVRADIELGGTDQLFNLMMGRRLQEQEGQAPQICITSPILAGLDGEKKMSKSLGNYVGVTDEPADMFGKVMSIPDAALKQWFTLLTREPEERVKELLDPKRTNPRDAKAELARLIVAQYHGEDSAAAARKHFDSVISGKGLPDDMPEFALSAETVEMWALVRDIHGVSGSEARRLCKQGGVHLIDPASGQAETIADEKATPDPDSLSGQVMKIGKRHFYRLLR